MLEFGEILLITMAKRPLLSEAAKGMILAYHNEGYNNSQIARMLNISEGCVRHNLWKQENFGNMSTRPRCGCPKKKTSARDDRALVNTSKRKRFLIAPALRQECNFQIVSVSTVRRRLRAAGLNGRIATRKPRLTDEHKRRRLQFATDHLHRTIEQWNKVLWSDESRFQLFLNDKRHQNVRHIVNEEYREDCVQATVKHGGHGIMVWGCMTRNGPGSCIRVEGTINQEKYLEILQETMIPTAHRTIGIGIYISTG